jgi:pyridoxal phosphate enzyme (YggS family)
VGRKGRSDMNDDFESRLLKVRERVVAACERSGRAVDDVSVLAVAKRFGPEDVTMAAECGLSVIGENRVQEAKSKIPLCPGNLEWHLIGHLQSNKVRDAVQLFSMIHSVDSLKLLDVLNGECELAGKIMRVCLEVNVSGEGSKYGFAPGDISDVLGKCEAMMNIEVAGLMTIPPVSADPEGARPFFRQLRELRDEWAVASGFPLTDLSMGMSHDFEVAVEEGATWVRLGTLLFGGRS